MIILTAFFATAFALIHIFIGRLLFLDVIPRSRWLSAAGGIAVAYIFLHILPELATHQATFAEELGASERIAETLIYAMRWPDWQPSAGLSAPPRCRAEGRASEPGKMPSKPRSSGCISARSGSTTC